MSAAHQQIVDLVQQASTLTDCAELKTAFLIELENREIEISEYLLGRSLQTATSQTKP